VTRHNLSAVIRDLRRMTDAGRSDGASDAELLERYVRQRDEAAFELLLWRHGALVYNVCRRMLSSEQDAEDAFQATFLAFVRKAGSIGRRASVASWLYKVAYRAALEARERAQKSARATTWKSPRAFKRPISSSPINKIV
jgi:DNA-directed RNA polymerase specialized sigma24 family protein